jgi:hypothetical protein
LGLGVAAFGRFAIPDFCFAQGDGVSALLKQIAKILLGPLDPSFGRLSVMSFCFAE